MLKILVKLLPVVALGVGLVNSQKIGGETLEAIRDMLYIHQTKQKISIISTALLADILTAVGFPSDFKAYCDEVCRVQGGGKCSVDAWGHEIYLFTENTGEAFEVASPGPDFEKDTEDDVYIKTPVK